MTPPVSGTAARRHAPRCPDKQLLLPVISDLVGRRGRSLESVARRTGLSHTTVSRWADEHGVPRRTKPRYPAELVAEVQRRVLAGESPSLVHRSLGEAGRPVGFTTVCRWARAARGGDAGERDYRLP